MGFSRSEEGKSRPFSFVGGNNRDLTSPESFTSWRDAPDVKERWEARWKVVGNTATKSVFGLDLTAENDDDGGNITRISDPASTAEFKKAVFANRRAFTCAGSFQTNCSMEQLERLIGPENVEWWEVKFPTGENWWE